MSDSTIVLYHAACADGFGAAWSAHTVLGHGPDVVYVPVQYGQPYPPEIDGGVARLFILDFSYPRATMERLAGCAGEIVCLDHHKTAQAELAGLPYAKFDMDKSGAVLAWEHFRPGEPVPLLLRYVQDRDLWQWILYRSRDFSAALGVEPRDFVRWDELAATFERQAHYFRQEEDGIASFTYYFLESGRAILAAQQAHVESLASHAVLTPIGPHMVPAVNCPIFQSELGEELCRRHEGSPFAAIFFLKDQETEIWSLRSIGDFDVSAVAKSLGGGGHRNAAGFVKKLNRMSENGLKQGGSV